jgi:tryptophan synthase alpha chain
MKQRISLQEVVQNKETPLCSIFFTAGYPKLESTPDIYLALQEAGVDFVEIGFPFSDPIADGSTIQKTSEQAIRNGMNLEVLFSQLRGIREQISMPIILMGYLNPVLRYGIERFVSDCSDAGVQGLILPDLPLSEYERDWKDLLSEKGISAVFLVTPQTSEERIREIDALSTSFIYAVSSQAVTGGTADSSSREFQEAYFKRLAGMKLLHPVVVGFGIHDKDSFDFASKHLQGGIIGSEFLRVIGTAADLESTIQSFITKINP